MNSKKIVRMMFLMCLLFGAGTFFCGIKTIQAQEKIVYTMKKGSSKTIKKLLKNHPFTKNNLAKYRNLTWKSTKPKVIEVKANRKLIAKKKGKAYLRGYDKKKKKVVAIRLIVGKKVKKITVPSTQISIPFGGSVRLEAAAKPENASYTKLHYEVKNPEIITVSAKGKVTSLASGSTSVTIYSKDGNSKKTVRVKVAEGTIRTTTKGNVKGTKSSDAASLIWYGIPYGASTAGKLLSRSAPGAEHGMRVFRNRERHVMEMAQITREQKIVCM